MMKKIIAILELAVDDSVNNVTDWILEEVGNNLMPGEELKDYFIAESDSSLESILDKIGEYN